jgi:hypothetical protein
VSAPAPFVPSPVEVGGIVAGCASALRPRARERGIRVRVGVAGRPYGPSVSAAEGQGAVAWAGPVERRPLACRHGRAAPQVLEDQCVNGDAGRVEEVLTPLGTRWPRLE